MFNKLAEIDPRITTWYGPHNLLLKKDEFVAGEQRRYRMRVDPDDTISAEETFFKFEPDKKCYYLADHAIKMVRKVYEKNMELYKNRRKVKPHSVMPKKLNINFGTDEMFNKHKPPEKNAPTNAASDGKTPENKDVPPELNENSSKNGPQGHVVTQNKILTKSSDEKTSREEKCLKTIEPSSSNEVSSNDDEQGHDLAQVEVPPHEIGVKTNDAETEKPADAVDSLKSNGLYKLQAPELALADAGPGGEASGRVRAMADIEKIKLIDTEFCEAGVPDLLKDLADVAGGQGNDANYMAERKEDEQIPQCRDYVPLCSICGDFLLLIPEAEPATNPPPQAASLSCTHIAHRNCLARALQLPEPRCANCNVIFDGETSQNINITTQPATTTPTYFRLQDKITALLNDVNARERRMDDLHIRIGELAEAESELVDALSKLYITAAEISPETIHRADLPLPNEEFSTTTPTVRRILEDLRQNKRFPAVPEGENTNTDETMDASTAEPIAEPTARPTLSELTRVTLVPLDHHKPLRPENNST
ncbi:hypothetical protein U1Q18_051069 [Sarracenia purpurea var. burkii]